MTGGDLELLPGRCAAPWRASPGCCSMTRCPRGKGYESRSVVATRRATGFTLLELLVVMVIIGLLAGLVAPRYFAQVGKSRTKVARAQINSLEQALDQYRLDVGHFPSTEEGLEALNAAPAGVDGWSGPYLKKAVPLTRGATRSVPATGHQCGDGPLSTARTGARAAPARAPTWSTGSGHAVPGQSHRFADAASSSATSRRWTSGRAAAGRRAGSERHCDRGVLRQWPGAAGARVPLVSFSQELVALLEAGLSLVEAIDTLTEKESNVAMRRALEQIRGRLFEGTRCRRRSRSCPRAFRPCTSRRCGPASAPAHLARRCVRYVAYQQQVDVLRKSRQRLDLSGGAVRGRAAGDVFLLGYVVPRFSGIYEDLGSDLPLASRLLMRWGQLLDAHGCALPRGRGRRGAARLRRRGRACGRGRRAHRAHSGTRAPPAHLPAGAPLPHGGHAAAWRHPGHCRHAHVGRPAEPTCARASPAQREVREGQSLAARWSATA